MSDKEEGLAQDKAAYPVPARSSSNPGAYLRPWPLDRAGGGQRARGPVNWSTGADALPRNPRSDCAVRCNITDCNRPRSPVPVPVLHNSCAPLLGEPGFIFFVERPHFDDNLKLPSPAQYNPSRLSNWRRVYILRPFPQGPPPLHLRSKQYCTILPDTLDFGCTPIPSPMRAATFARSAVWAASRSSRTLQASRPLRLFSIKAEAASDSKQKALDPNRLSITQTSSPKPLSQPETLVFGREFTGMSCQLICPSMYWGMRTA